jgi:hypothetical protein
MQSMMHWCAPVSGDACENLTTKLYLGTTSSMLLPMLNLVPLSLSLSLSMGGADAFENDPPFRSKGTVLFLVEVRVPAPLLNIVSSDRGTAVPRYRTAVGSIVYTYPDTAVF